MTEGELKNLAEKVSTGLATNEEKLFLINELNTVIKNLRQDLKEIKIYKEKK